MALHARGGLVGLVPNGSCADHRDMTYIIERKTRFYVVAYDGINPATGRERRRWHPAGHSRLTPKRSPHGLKQWQQPTRRSRPGN